MIYKQFLQVKQINAYRIHSNVCNLILSDDQRFYIAKSFDAVHIFVSYLVFGEIDFLSW